MMNRKIKLKVCGMRDPDNILQVAELHPDYMGFIFYEKSKRFVGSDFKIPVQLDKSIKRVGVFVNESTGKILELAEVHNLDFIQLHGNESINQCVELKKIGLGVIKVFSINEHFIVTEVTPYRNGVDYFLFDTQSDNYGGSGKAFDWNLLKGYDLDIPFVLSGGLSASNIQSAKDIESVNLHAFDLNSGVEISAGVKGVEKLKELIKIINT